MASKLHILGILGLLVVISSASYDYSNMMNLKSVDHELHEYHHRSKRAVPYPNSPENPPNVTFYLTKLGEHENVTSMSVGSYVRFQLIIHFPIGTTDILVELFTPDNSSTIMKLCNPEVMSLGSKLTVNVDGATRDLATINKLITKEGKTPDTKDYDRAIITLGNVTALAAATNTPTEAMIKIEWEAVMIDNSVTVNGGTYWVSAGAEYNKDSEVWVGQASFTANIDNYVPTINPTANFTGPDTMQIGSSASFKVDLFIPFPSVALTFDAFAPLNFSGVMSVCSIAITDVGRNYDCLDKERNYTTYPSPSGRGNERGRLVIGTVTNKDARKEILSDGRITLEFVMYMFDNTSVVGQTYWVGAAVEIGTNKIWAGQLQVQAIAKLTNDIMTTDPTFVSFINGSSAAGVGDTVVMGVNMTVPKNQPGVYNLEALAAYNVSAPQMRICKVVAVYNGVNIPCLSNSQVVYKSRDNITDKPDQATWDLGKITNFGIFNETSTYMSPDVVSFSIAAEVLDHSYNTPGANVWLMAGMMFTQQKLWLGQNSVTIGPATNASSTAPVFKMSFKNSSDQLWINESGMVYLEITTEAHTVYRPMEMEFILPFENNTAMMTLCKIEIIYVGGNFPCFNQARFNSSFTLTSKVNDTKKPDKALITLQQIYNVGYSKEPKENTIIFAFSFKVQDHVGLTEGAKRFVSAGVMYGPVTIWVGQLQVTAKRAGAPTSAAPYIQAIRVDDPGHMNIPIGGVVAYDLIIKMNPISSSRISIAATGSANLKVCVVKLMEKGTNLPCVQEDLNSTTTGLTTKLDLGIVTNLAEEAMVSNSTFDNNTLRVRVYAQLDFNAGVAAGSTHTLQFLVDNEQAAGWTNPAQQTFTALAAAAPNSTNATNPTFAFNVHSVEGDGMTLSNNKMAKGEAKLFRLDIKPKHNTANKIQVKFLTPVNSTGEVEFCSVNVLHVGLNMPCVKRETFNGTETFLKRYNSPYNDIGGIDLGYICYQQFYNSSEEEKITVEGVAKLLPNSSLAVGAEFYISATVMINDDQIYVTQIKMVVASLTEFNNTVFNSSSGGLKMVEVSNTLLQWRPGSLYTVQFALRVPPNSSTIASAQISTPKGTTSVMTLKNFKVISAGLNIGCILANRTKDELPMSLNASVVGSTQLDRGYIPLGVITNHGARFRINGYKQDDDLITFEGELQMADADINTVNSVHKLSFGAKVGAALYILDKNVAVSRDGTEQPQLLLNITSNDTITYEKGTPILISALLYHETVSSAEAYNVAVTFFYPKLLTFLGVVFCNHTTPTTEAITVPGNGIRINFTRILFTDAANFSIQLGVDETATLPIGLAAIPDAITPFEAASNKIGRTVDNFVAGYVFVTRMDSLSFKVQLPPSSGCGNSPLGMQDARIQDCQLDSSYTPQTTGLFRYGQAGYWTSATRGGYMEKSVVINFGNITRVTSIALEHPAVNSRVTQYRVQYSNDGITYTDGEIVSPTPSYGTSVNNLTTPQDSRYLKVLFMGNEGGADGTVSVRLEAYGCTTLGDVSINDVCKKKPWDSMKKATDFVSRGFLATTSTVYYCDAVSSDGDEMKCFSSSDALTWKSVDPVVVNVIGHLPSKDEIYAIAKDKRSYLVSYDGGATWYSMSNARYAKMQAEPGFVAHAAASWVKDATVADPASGALTKGTWAAGYKGIYSYGTVVADWTKCCAP